MLLISQDYILIILEFQLENLKFVSLNNIYELIILTQSKPQNFPSTLLQYQEERKWL